MAEPTSRRAVRLAGLDERSLALLRVGLGVILLWDLATRSLDRVAHYTDAGVLPLASLAWPGSFAAPIFRWASTSPAMVSLLLGICAVAAAALVVGWHTRWATAVAWLLLLSLQERNPGLNFGGDVMLRLLLFWSLFLPVGAVWSVDARRTRGVGPRLHVSGASVALLAQLALVYLFSVAHRAGSSWWDGNALAGLLHYDQFATPVGIWLRGHEAWLPALNDLTLFLEIAGPLLLLCPFGFAIVRTALVVAFVGFHAALGVCVDLGPFAAVFVVAWLALLPSKAWQRLGGRAVSGVSRPQHAAIAMDVVALLAIGGVIASNVLALSPDRYDIRGSRLEAGLDWLGLAQRWALVAEAPIYDGWYVFKGVEASGETIDLLDRTREPSWEKPALVAREMPTRWRRLLFDMALQAEDLRFAGLARWLCSSRGLRPSRHPPPQLDRVLVYYVRETTTPDGPHRGEILTLAVRSCSDLPASPRNHSRSP